MEGNPLGGGLSAVRVPERSRPQPETIEGAWAGRRARKGIERVPSVLWTLPFRSRLSRCRFGANLRARSRRVCFRQTQVRHKSVSTIPYHCSRPVQPMQRDQPSPLDQDLSPIYDDTRCTGQTDHMYIRCSILHLDSIRPSRTRVRMRVNAVESTCI